jgi:hypothetical protein
MNDVSGERNVIGAEGLLALERHGRRPLATIVTMQRRGGAFFPIPSAGTY